VFLAPAVLFAGVGLLFFFYVRNAPEDVGLPSVEAEDGSAPGAPAGGQTTLVQNIVRTLNNPYLWIVAGTFFLLDVNRYGFVNWLPAYLDDRQVSMGVSDFGVQDVIARLIHPLAGALGAIVAGWATDRFFSGRRAPVIAILLALLGGFSIVFTYLPYTHTWLLIFVLALVGFCTYGPHILMVGHAAQDFGKKSGAAGAAGFIDGTGYIGASLAGYGAGVIIKAYGYEVNFVIFGLAAILGSFLICLLWRAGPGTHTVGSEYPA
jgi:sugar phosphate permease